MRFARQAGWLVFIVGFEFITPHNGLCSIEGGFIVIATDTSSSSIPPPSTIAELNGEEIQSFGTNNIVTFAGQYEADIHTVEVATTTSGYLPRASPTDPNGIHDPDSDYGNPRHVEISQQTNFASVGFLFDPIVTATAVVRDVWTMERIEDAFIEFMYKDPTGDIPISKYPWSADYATNWSTDAAGNFPANTILYLGNYDLNIVRTGYELFTLHNIISDAAAGDNFDMGTLFLHPIDDNNNQIADAWETLYFGPGSTVEIDADPDGDGMVNRSEYIAGTDPTNHLSNLWMEPSFSSDKLTLTWPTEHDRTYRIGGTTNLCTDTWIQVGGIWEATNGQAEMVWIENNMDLSWNSYYRVEVVPCWEQGINQILINTNEPDGTEGTADQTWEDVGIPEPEDP